MDAELKLAYRAWRYSNMVTGGLGTFGALDLIRSAFDGRDFGCKQMRNPQPHQFSCDTKKVEVRISLKRCSRLKTDNFKPYNNIVTLYEPEFVAHRDANMSFRSYKIVLQLSSVWKNSFV